MARITGLALFFWTIHFIPVQALGLDILYLGDSQSVGYFGGHISDFLKNPLKNCGVDASGSENNVDFFAVSGSSPRHWSDRQNKPAKKAWLCQQRFRHQTGPSGNFQAPNYLYGTGLCQPHNGYSVIDRMMTGSEPDVAVINFSGNSAAFRNSREFRESIENLINQLPPGTPCIWMTNPPSRHRVVSTAVLEETQDKILEVLEDMGSNGKARCHFVPGITADSKRDFSLNSNYLAGDKLHLSSRGARYWFNDVVKPNLCQNVQTLFNHGGSGNLTDQQTQEN